MWLENKYFWNVIFSSIFVTYLLALRFVSLYMIVYLLTVAYYSWFWILALSLSVWMRLAVCFHPVSLRQPLKCGCSAGRCFRDFLKLCKNTHMKNEGGIGYIVQNPSARYFYHFNFNEANYASMIMKLTNFYYFQFHNHAFLFTDFSLSCFIFYIFCNLN